VNFLFLGTPFFAGPTGGGRSKT